MMILALAGFAAAVEKIAATPALRHAVVAVEVYDLRDKRILYARNAQTLMIAASTTKLVTEGVSLSLLGADFRWSTAVYATGPIDRSGVLHGDLVLVASGDPNLSDRIRPDGSLAYENIDHSYGGPGVHAVPGDPFAVLRELSAQVAHFGVKSVAGNVVVDTSLFPQSGPESGTGAQLSPIVVNDNLIDVTLHQGAKPGDPVGMDVRPQTSYAKVLNRIVTANGPPAISPETQDDRDGDETITLKGSLPPGAGSGMQGLPVHDPRRFAEAAFVETLQDAGVDIREGTSAQHAPVTRTLVARHLSPPLWQDVVMTMKVSQNLHAALMPYLWAVYVAHATSDYLKAGFALEKALLASAGLDVAGLSQEDGFGGNDAFSADFMVKYLAWARSQYWFPHFFAGLPVLGVDGTLAMTEMQSPARGKVHAKTGSWDEDDFVGRDVITQAGLAGYLTSRRGRELAFAFYLNQMKQPRDAHGFGTDVLGEIATAAYLNY